MSLSERVANAKPLPIVRGRCKVSKYLDDMNSEDAATFVYAVFGDRFDAVQVSRDLLAPEGIFVSDTQIRAHRRGDCKTCSLEGRYGAE